MIKDELIVKILVKVNSLWPNFEHHKLREILDEVLYEYDVTEACTALVVANNLIDRIKIYISTKQLDGLSKATLYNYALHLVRFSNYIRKNVEDINTADLRMYLSALGKDTGMKNTSMSTEISILKSFFNWLEQEDYIIKSPARKLKQPKTEKRLRHGLNVEELEILKESCKTLRERALVEVLYCTGSRLDEIVKLNKESIDWQNMCVKVIGKGNKERTVFISPKAKIHLQKYLSSRTDNCEALFVTIRKPIHRLGRRAIEREIGKIGERAGFNKSIFPHLLRHTTASLLLNNGADMVTVQKILGHEDISTTQVYAQASDEHVQTQYKKHLIQ